MCSGGGDGEEAEPAQESPKVSVSTSADTAVTAKEPETTQEAQTALSTGQPETVQSPDAAEQVTTTRQELQEQQPQEQESTAAGFDLSQVPAYSGSAEVTINADQPYFELSDLVTDSFENYSSLDALGRCGVAYACLGPETLPTEERGSIGSVKPTGWHTVKYAGIEGNYLYNRCHLIAYELSAENANERNLITGTRYLNIEGMLVHENAVAKYIRETGNHVMYRVTPVFEGNNLLASGVLMEAESVEGDEIRFCRFCYNVQPGITINYADGSSSGPEFLGSSTDSDSDSGYAQQTQEPAQTPAVTAEPESGSEAAYIGNANTKKFHYPSCSSVSQMNESNKVSFSSRDEAISSGYDPCQRCNP